jgi:hypothetical protein
MTRVSEGEITPVTVKQGLNRQQQRARQMPAKFQPKKISVLDAKTDPPHPAQGLAVGAMEGLESPNRLAETMADIEEDMLSRMRQDLNTYLDKLADRVADDGRRDHKRPKRDKLGAKPQNDPGLVTNHRIQAQETPARVMALEDGSLIEIYGDDSQGYEIRRGDRCISKRFPNLGLAETMLDLFQAHRTAHTEKQDYLDEK